MAMGGIDKRRFGQFKDLLNLSDEAMEIADRHQLDERVLRHVIGLSPADQIEAILEHGTEQPADTDDDLPVYAVKFARTLVRDIEKQDPDTLWLAVCREQGDPTMAQAYLKRLAQLALKASQLLAEEG